MKKTIVLFVILTNALFINAQHDYDNQGVIYSLPGQVGINDNSPLVNLGITGEQNTMLRLHRKNNSSFAPWGIGFSTRTDGFDSGGLSDLRSGIFGNYNGDLFLAAKQGVSIDSDPLAYSRLYVDGSSGNVGIGKIDPVDRLDIYGHPQSKIRLSTNNAAYNLTLEANYNSVDKFHLRWNGTGILGNTSLAGSTPTYLSGHYGIAFLTHSGITDDKIRMFIKSNGDVGVGTINPSSNFEVHGSSVNTFKVKNPIGSSASVSRFFNNADRGPEFVSYGSNYSAGSYFGVGANNGALVFNQKATVGTSGNDDLNLGTNGSNRMTISNNGNVGIGTTSPKERLHLEGNFLLDSYSAGNDNGLFFRENFSTTNKYNLSILTYDHSNSGVSPDGLSLNAYDGISFSTGSNVRNERMRISLNGNVGIGTTSPNNKLTVNGGIANVAGSGGVLTLFDDDLTVGNRAILGADTDGAFLKSTWSSGGTDAISFRNSTDEQVMLITADDNVNIGTTTLYPDYKLSVAGKGRFTEVKVQPEIEWMDIVFEEDYDLRSLEEVKKYIDENGHLPDIPSAEEVAENGFGLGEMDANLLRKIEELTIYLLDKEEEVKNLKDEMKAMKKNLEVLNHQSAKNQQLEMELNNLKQLLLNKN